MTKTEELLHHHAVKLAFEAFQKAYTDAEHSGVEFPMEMVKWFWEGYRWDCSIDENGKVEWKK